ncbi:MAG TPA: transcription termination factor NusA [Anaerolineae bacterium]|nr:transcription termination factor NusA [Anaerolineae bacterium]HQH37657.1 transcription termination factor NusA [Anaerolineae bacterium]
MKSEFSLAFNQICAEYSLPREVVLDAVRAALVTAYRRDWKVDATQNVTADISLETGLARIFLEKVAVETVEDPLTQITLNEARGLQPGIQLDELLMVDVTPHNFGRIAAQTAKQVITQRLREAERESQFNRFSRQENEIIIGTVQSVAPHGVTLHLERTEEAHMPRREQIPGEHYMLHQKIRVYVLEVKRTSRGPEIVVSRSHPLMLRRLLELEVPEIRAGQVEINAVAREAGVRAKVAVSSRQVGLDPVGACVGMRGIRIQTISNELHDERIDVIEWNQDPAIFIANALSMKDVFSVVLDENNPGGRTASVVVLDDQLSLAIGRAGQNARLAAKLTGWRIDIQGATEAALWALEQVNSTPELLDTLKTAAPFIPRLAAIMRAHETDPYPYTDEERRIIKTTVEAVRQAIITRRDADRPAIRQARARRSAQEKANAERRKAQQAAQASVPRAAYAQDLKTLILSDKVYSHLINSGVSNVGDVMERLALGDEDMLMIEGIGVKALREIKDAMAASGLQYIAAVEAPVVGEAGAGGESEGTAAVESIAVLPVEAVAPTEKVGGEVEETEVAREAETAPEVAEAVTADVTVATVEATEAEEGQQVKFAESYVNVFEDDELLEEDDENKDKRKKKKGRTVLYDDKTGETFVVRQRRRPKDMWDNFGDEF